MGVNQSPLPAVPSLTLGSNSVTPLEMASAYASFAAGGVYRKPRIISKITFAGSDRVVKVKSKGKRVMADGVAAEVTRILGENMRGGTGTHARTSRRPPAGRQDGHHRQHPRRVVLRLHTRPRDLRLDRLPGLREVPAARRRGRRHRLRRHASGRDLARLHGRRAAQGVAARLPEAEEPADVHLELPVRVHRAGRRRARRRRTTEKPKKGDKGRDGGAAGGGGDGAGGGNGE